MSNPYEEFAQRFVSDKELDDAEAQFEVMKEEFDEFRDAFTGQSDERVEEELADVLVTCFVFAEITGIDVRSEYVEKMRYNMQKSASKDASGKVTDDVGEAN